MNEESKIRQILDLKIKQRMAPTDNITDYSQNLLHQLESMHDSSHFGSSNQKILEGQQLSQQLQRQQEEQHKLQMAIDRLRIRMLEIAKEEDLIRERIAEKRKLMQKERENLESNHQLQNQKVEGEYQQKKENILKQIESLIEQKSQFINKIQQASKDIQKAQSRNKRAQQNYTKQMKSRKQAYLSIQRQKSHKYQQTRLTQIKEQAVKDTEPKLLAIIKSANDDIKKAEEQQKQNLENFKSEHKLTLERQLTENKQRAFQEGQQEKESLKADIDRRNKERYEQKEKDFQEQIARLKEQYSARIKEEQLKIRSQMDQFFSRNRDSHDTNIDEIRQLKTTYQAKLRKMNNNIQQLQNNKLTQYETKHKKIYETQIHEIDQTNQQKMLKAQQKIKADIESKMQKIQKQIIKEQQLFREEVTATYDKMLLKEQKKYEEGLQKERKNIEGLEDRIIQIQKQVKKQEARAHQLQKQRNALVEKQQDLERKIAGHEAELSAFERLKIQREKQAQKKFESINQQQQIRYQQLKQQFLAKQDLKKAREKQLLDQYQQQSIKNNNALLAYRSQIQSNIASRKSVLQKLVQENNRLEQENSLTQQQIEEQSRQLRS